MFPSLAAPETHVAETNFSARKQENVFASRTQILLPKHMFPSLATMKAMLTSFQDCSLSQFIIVRMRDLLNVSSFSHRGSKTFCLLPANLATPKT